ncbi:MAG TPA: hypothetical protein VHA71_12395 [Rhodanobacteraceae bacterium]|nr:hypothetical protein [Rhodanobacteraceae bacterium]
MLGRKHALVAMVLLLGPVLPVIAGHSQDALHLSATIDNGILVAVLSNVSGRSVKTLGVHVSPFPGSGGFYVRLHDAGGSLAKYCAMINETNPAEHVLRPHATLVYRESVRSLANQYCLHPGRYTAQVVYFNSMPASGAIYSGPAKSAELELVVPGASE